MKHDPQEPQSIWWLTKMDVIGFRVVLAEDEQPELDRAEAEGREEVGIVAVVSASVSETKDKYCLGLCFHFHSRSR